MDIRIYRDKAALGAAAAARAAEAINEAVRRRGAARLILATGASQFEVLAALVGRTDVPWPAVTMFHLDEYIGLPAAHPASFRRYLRERFVEKAPGLAAAHFVDGEAADPWAECRRLGGLVAAAPVDVALIGIGENGHLAFNDPPADFDTEEPYLVVDLDEACRRQQMGEGWFPTLADVPRQAISMSIRQIVKCRRLVCSVPDRRKAVAVRRAVEGDVTNVCPASILRTHPDCLLLLDTESASLVARPPEVQP